MAQTIPDHLIPLVESYLIENITIKKTPITMAVHDDFSNSSSGSPISLKGIQGHDDDGPDDEAEYLDPVITATIWDFGGHPDLIPMHQLFLASDVSIGDKWQCIVRTSLQSFCVSAFVCSCV